MWSTETEFPANVCFSFLVNMAITILSSILVSAALSYSIVIIVTNWNAPFY